MFKTDFNADESRLAKGRKGRKAWPADCLWPEPVWDGTHGGVDCQGKLTHFYTEF